MEDGVFKVDGVETAPRTPPPPPSPNADTGAASVDATYNEKSDEPLILTSERWDITSISALAALRMLIQALESLAEATGDVPPTPPVSRPTTPTKDDALRRVSSGGSSGPTPLPPITIGSPEAHPHEPITVIGANAEEITLQHTAIGRRFFSKVAPSFSISDYLMRIHHYCPHSPGVYLSAASYCHRLCVSDLMVPATSRTVHRLALASVRVSAKALEDNKWTQDRMAKVGGVSNNQLKNLEVALCFLLDFDLWVDDRVLATRMFLLQQAAGEGKGARGTLGDSFKLKLPLRKKMAMAIAAG
jgi:hypothetical protein